MTTNIGKVRNCGRTRESSEDAEANETHFQFENKEILKLQTCDVFYCVKESHPIDFTQSRYGTYEINFPARTVEIITTLFVTSLLCLNFPLNSPNHFRRIPYFTPGFDLPARQESISFGMRYDLRQISVVWLLPNVPTQVTGRKWQGRS